MSLVDRYSVWFDHELDGHRATLEALDTVPEAGRNERYQQALDLFAHMMAARRLWLFRLGAVESGPTTLDEVFPTDTGRGSLSSLLDAMATDWRVYLGALDHSELGRDFEYTTTGGARYSNSVEEILTQLWGHAWHHRGQIMSIVRQCGGDPAACDFVYWTRRPIDSSDG